MKAFSIIKSIIPQCIINQWRLVKIRNIHSNYPKIIEQLKNNEKIKVAFFVIHSSVWKLDSVFQMMLNDERFEPVIVICPYVMYGEERMLEDMNQADSYFKSKKYTTITTYNTQNKQWLDVKKTIRPDIIFFTNPHQLTKEEYYITSYPQTLTCYVPYAFIAVDTYESQFNQFFHNVVWTLFYETPIHQEIARKHSLIKGKNVYITGYPGCDIFLNKNYQPRYDPWKDKDRIRKRLIWAPHHLMREGVMNSNFLEYYQVMFDIAKKYEHQLQIAFKPHPIMKSKLYTYQDWGKEKTDTYYEEWKSLLNGQLEEGDYIDLFHTSDALLHDSGSFISEYLSLGKPTMYMISNENVMKGWNEYGKKAIDAHYLGFTYDQVEEFIENVVLKGIDSKQETRNKFVNENLKFDDRKDASKRIFEYIDRVLK